jgi:hypothetical protein
MAGAWALFLLTRLGFVPLILKFFFMRSTSSHGCASLSTGTHSYRCQSPN